MACTLYTSEYRSRSNDDVILATKLPNHLYKKYYMHVNTVLVNIT